MSINRIFLCVLCVSFVPCVVNFTTKIAKILKGYKGKIASYTVARHKLVVFVGSDWREQPQRRPLSLWDVFSGTG